MTRNQRRKRASAKAEAKLLSLVEAQRQANQQRVINANVRALRSGARFERSGDLSPRAYRDYRAHSGTGHVMGQSPVWNQ